MRRVDRTSAGRAFSLFNTAIGTGGVVAGDRGLVDVLLPFDREDGMTAAEEIAVRFPVATGENEVSRQAAALLSRYFSGEAVGFSLKIDWTGFTSFQYAVYKLVASIGYGKVMSYSDVASAMGTPGAARGVGGAMARNPLPIIIPCHRVIGKAGFMTGYSAPGGIASKQWLLQMELPTDYKIMKNRVFSPSYEQPDKDGKGFL